MKVAEWVRTSVIGGVAGLCLAFGNFAVAAADSAELASFRQAIRAKYDMKEKAFHVRDGEAIVTKFYAEDVVSAGEGSTLHRGREELRKLYQTPEVIQNEVRIVSFHTHVNGNAGWDWADFHVTPADRKVAPFTFKILFLWEKVHGEWWCKGDMYVVDKSPSAPTTEQAATH
jgi:ketosteroid isomerase-like protein